MPRKGAPENLIPLNKRSKEEQKKIQSRGGKKSGETRRAKKTIQKLLSDYLDSDCKDNPTLKKLAKQLGLESDESVKNLFVVTCIMHSLQRGDIADLATVQALLGEDKTDKKETGVKIIDDL